MKNPADLTAADIEAVLAAAFAAWFARRVERGDESAECRP